MGRPINKLSALQVARLTTPGLYSDGAGLWLQVSPSGTKSWVFRYAIAGRRHHMGLGALRDVALADALATYVLPVFGALRVDQVDTPLIIKALSAI